MGYKHTYVRGITRSFDFDFDLYVSGTPHADQVTLLQQQTVAPPLEAI